MNYFKKVLYIHEHNLCKVLSSKSCDTQKHKIPHCGFWDTTVVTDPTFLNTFQSTTLQKPKMFIKILRKSGHLQRQTHHILCMLT